MALAPCALVGALTKALCCMFVLLSSGHGKTSVNAKRVRHQPNHTSVLLRNKRGRRPNHPSRPTHTHPVCIPRLVVVLYSDYELYLFGTKIGLSRVLVHDDVGMTETLV